MVLNISGDGTIREIYHLISLLQSYMTPAPQWTTVLACVDDLALWVNTLLYIIIIRAANKAELINFASSFCWADEPKYRSE